MLGFSGEGILGKKGCDGNPESDWCCSVVGGFWRGQQLGKSSLVPWRDCRGVVVVERQQGTRPLKKIFLIKEAAKEKCKTAETKACKKDEAVYLRAGAGK